MNNFLKLNNLSKKYEKNKSLKVLNNINFKFESGKVYSIILITLCSIIITSIVSIYPASRAAKLDTIQTIKYE